MARSRRFTWRAFAPGLAGYTMFGVGYIGYMTFVIALLREQGVGPGAITLFYALLGWRWWRRRASGPGCWTAPRAAARWPR
jgi:hypothetical protein